MTGVALICLLVAAIAQVEPAQAQQHDSQRLTLLPAQLYALQQREQLDLLLLQRQGTHAGIEIVEQQETSQRQVVKHAMQHVSLMHDLRHQQQLIARHKAHSQASGAYDQNQGSGPQAEAGHLCVVVRTYQGHGPGPAPAPGPLRQLIESLRASKHTKWQVLFVVSDGEPFPALDQMLNELNDSRISIHTLLVGKQHAARDQHGQWNPGYHHTLFKLTDQAISACSPDTRWVTITNGDNAYDPRFWETVGQQPAPDSQAGPHIIAFDFYSRYQRHTGPQCHRFAAGPDNPPCKENLLRFCQTDLASVALDWQRWTSEGRGFAHVAMSDWEKRQGWHDGLAVHAIVAAGWQVKWFGPGAACLVAHSPNPQLCAMEGGVWDDSDKAGAQAGGRCVSAEEAAVLAAQPGLEMVHLQLSHDPGSFLAQPDTVSLPAWPAGGYSIKCIRQVNEIPTVQIWNNPEFNSKCSALMDQPANQIRQAGAWLQEAERTIAAGLAIPAPPPHADEL